MINYERKQNKPYFINHLKATIKCSYIELFARLSLKENKTKSDSNYDSKYYQHFITPSATRTL